VPAGSSGKTSSVTDEAVSELPERLTVSEVRARMSKIHKRVTACRKTLDKDGPKLLRLKLTIGPDGTISSAKPKQTGKLGTCIWTALSSETFPKTKHGVGFSYPFRRGD